jgi:hypothetical protein
VRRVERYRTYCDRKPDMPSPLPNVTWQEPQVLVDLLALNLLADRNGMRLPGAREIALVSPWLSDVEIYLRAGVWQQRLTVGDTEGQYTLDAILGNFREAGWDVHVAVLSYGSSGSGLTKDPTTFRHEREFLARLLAKGVKVYLVPDLHAKGVVTPLAIITGSTNITGSGLFAQSQNANYFAFDHSDYAGNRLQLMSRFAGRSPIATVP